LDSVFQRGDGFAASNEQGDNHKRKNNNIPQGQNGIGPNGDRHGAGLIFFGGGHEHSLFNLMF
jgi:hypothetical protein